MTFNKVFGILLVVFLSACSANYNFTGSSVPDTAKAIYIAQIFNRSAGGPSSLSIDFTEKLREYFQQNTNLTLETKPVPNELSLTGTIDKYVVTNIAPQTTSSGQESAALNRLTITVSMTYTNPLNAEDDFTESFSFPADYPADQSLSAVENELIEEITDQLILKIFNRCFGNW